MICRPAPFKSLRRFGGSPDARVHSDRDLLTERPQGPRGRNASIFTMPEMVRNVLSVALLFGGLFFLLWLPEIMVSIAVSRGVGQ